ncbi:MAG: TonB-dependent receptor [Lonepinella koalarum]|nr:TonB-dependent receptor [Lonepinella koalarum]
MRDYMKTGKSSFPKSLIALLVIAFVNEASASTQQTEVLDEIVVETKAGGEFKSFSTSKALKASDVTIEGEKFKTRSATLGNALAGELGVHSNPFGGGASAPIIRGQEGVRVKILQNGSDVVDMSSMSPDHAVAADTLLAEQVELVRGTPTLLYSTASPSGVVNVIDKRIPEKVPSKGIEGELATRWDYASKEKASNIGATFGIGEHLAFRVEGLTRKSDNYRVPGVKLGQTLNYLPDTHNRSTVGTLGLSFSGSKGYIGVSYSKRQDRYGIPGHNHQFDKGAFHIFNIAKNPFAPEKEYLNLYPHLMRDVDISDNLHDAHTGTSHDFNAPHSHDNPYGHEHDHSGPGPWIDMVSERYDIRGEWLSPIIGIEKLKLTLAWADYYHDEKDDGKAYIGPNITQAQRETIEWERKRNKGRPSAFFGNKGFNSRLEIHHKEYKGLSGVWGIQYQTQESYASRPKVNGNDCEPILDEHGNIQYTRDGDRRERCNSFGERLPSQRRPLVHNTNKQLSLFALEQYQLGNWVFEGAIRWEKQRIPIHYDYAELERVTPPKKPRNAKPDLTEFQQKALSYSGTILWDFHPDFRFSFTLSHNERLPTPVELYYHGKHLATNSFEYGNRDLTKEISNNYELGLVYTGSRWDFKISLYHNRFKNYINNETIYREGHLYMRRYMQSEARFRGLEGEIGFNITPDHKLSLFGDYVRGKLFNLPSIYGPAIIERYRYLDEDGDWMWGRRTIGYEMVHRPDRNAARVPPARLGFRLNSQFNHSWSGTLEYTRVFTQNKTSTSFYLKKKSEDDPTNVPGNTIRAVPIYEDSTKGYDLLNLGVHYHGHFNKLDYTLTLQGNNLLNQKIYSHTSFLPYVPQMGRNFIFGVNVNF